MATAAAVAPATVTAATAALTLLTRSMQCPFDEEGTTPAEWIQAWDAVRADINGSGAAPFAWWMWAPNVDTGGTTTAFAPW